MRRLVLLLPLLAACSGYWNGVFAGRMTVITRCPSTGDIVEEVHGDVELAENEEDDDILEVSIRTGVNDVSGARIAGNQCIGLTALSDGDEASFKTITCPKSSADEVQRSVKGGELSIDGNTLKLSFSVESPNAVKEPTETCEQVYTGKLERSGYSRSYY